MTRAVVFAYHNVGVRCLRVLLAHGVDVPLVVTHATARDETIWFDSVAATAAEYGIADGRRRTIRTRRELVAPRRRARAGFPVLVLLPEDAEGAAARGRRRAARSTCTARCCRRYRGRAPVNWAVLHGERETGATLHYMTEKPDAGDIVAQTAVPILPDDTAREVFDKVTVAAEITLDRVLPALVAGTAPRAAAGSRARDAISAAASPRTGRSTGAATPPRSTIWSARSRRRTRARSRRSAASPRACCARASSIAATPPHADADARGARRSPRRALRRRRHVAVLSLEVDGAARRAAALTARFGTAPAVLGGARR